MNTQICFQVHDVTIRQTAPGHLEDLAVLQEVVFPTLHEDQRFSVENYRNHLRIFPEGQFVALLGDRVVGMSSTIRYMVDFDDMQHTFDEIAQGGSLNAHNPNGSWLYGADIGVHPECRRRGIARGLYHARQLLVAQLQLEGQYTVGMPSGYGTLSETMSMEEYYSKLEQGELFDPTVSVQQSFGFQMRGIIAEYVQDPVCANYGIVLVLDKSVVLQ